MVLETTCCGLGEMSEVSVSKDLILSGPPKQLPIVWPQEVAGLGTGWTQPTVWPLACLGPAHGRLVSAGGVSDQKGELGGPAGYRYEESHSQRVHVLIPGSKETHLGTRCLTGSPEIRATQVTRNRQEQGSSSSILISLILLRSSSFLTIPVCPALRAYVPTTDEPPALCGC